MRERIEEDRDVAHIDFKFASFSNGMTFVVI